jgi:glycosyltransferase involved in cell wall biosynthesis
MESTRRLPVARSTAATRRQAVLYVLHSGRLFGTERMAIATLSGLGPDFDSLLLAPPGEAVEYARSQGITANTFSGRAGLAASMVAFFARHRRVTLLATGLSHALTGSLAAALTATRLRHLHVVHGGTDEHLSYGRKKWLGFLGTDYVAVSDFVRERLVAHGVPAARIRVVENFLPSTRQPRRAPFAATASRAVLVSRLDPIKRVGLLLEALCSAPALSSMTFDIYGTGWEETTLREQAAAAHLPIAFHGFCPDIPAVLPRADLLVHTCPDEPFGLAVLEAMAAGIPVLVPDRGGPASFIEDGVNGFVYRANDASQLAARLVELYQAAPEMLNRIVAAADATLRTRFSAERRIADYRAVIVGDAA